jgi:hypothetical protein
MLGANLAQLKRRAANRELTDSVRFGKLLNLLSSKQKGQTSCYAVCPGITS